MSATRSDLRVAMIAGGSVAEHPYIALLSRALRERGVQIDQVPSLTRSWVRELSPAVSAIHLHWPDFLGYRSSRPVVGPIATELLGRRTRADLRALRAAPQRFVWTVHDLLPHDVAHRRLETSIFQEAALADGLLVHSRDAVERVRATFRVDGRIEVVPHPNFIGWYPADSRSRDEIRSELGIPAEAFTYLLFGHIRPYKQTPQAISAFRALPDGDARLLVAGKSATPEVEAEVRAAAGGDPRVVLHTGYVPDERVEALHRAADAVVLNHREIFTSGALLLALSFGLPVVAPRSAALAEMVAPPAAQSFEPGGLTEALRTVRGGDQGQRRAAATAAAERCSWDRMAEAAIALYRGEPG